ncbi:MAG: MG2 domain-containing protein [Fimbriimonas sp.]|nr:MG2 domain-containing protein [Fimbriimonas sp.]
MRRILGIEIGQFLALVAGLVLCIIAFSFGVTQETPFGQLEGTVLLAETGKPLAEAEVMLSVHDDDNARERSVTCDKKGHFRFRNVKVGDYDLSVSASEHTQKPRTITVTEGRPTRATLRLDPNDPYLKLYASQRVWMPSEAPKLELHGFRVGSFVDVQVDRIDIEQMLKSGMFGRAVNGLRIGEGSDMPPVFKGFSSSEVDFRHGIKNRDYEGAFVDPLSLPVLNPGFYWVKCKGAHASISTYVNVSSIALVTKTARGRLLAFVTDLTSGQPVQNATVYSRPTSAGVAVTRTNVDGLAESRYMVAGPNDDARAAVLATVGRSVAVVGVYTNAQSNGDGDANIVLYTDRPVYRPGDVVQFKGIVRSRSGEKYLPPKPGPIHLVVKDTDDEPMAKLEVQASVHGAFHGSFVTSKEAGPGSYRIEASGFGGMGSQTVSMVSYRKPEFSIQIKPLRANYIIGDKIQVAVQCSYYYGGPVVGAKLNANIYASAAFRHDADDDEAESSYAYRGGDLSKQVEVTTDAKGQAIVEFESRQPNDSAIPMNDLDFSIDVSTSDESHKYVSESGSVRATRGAFDLTVQSENYLARPGQDIDLQVSTKTNTDDRLPVPNATVTIAVSKESWKDEKSVLRQLGTYTCRTGPDGIVHVPVRASTSGSILMVADSRDEGGHIIRSEDHVYVLGEAWNAEADQSRIDVTLDKRHYKAGDQARVMIRTISPGGSALVTVQTSTIIWKRVVALPGTTTLITLPVASEYSPNCFVSVAYVRKKKFYEANTRLSVDPEHHKLQISVQSGRATYLPGDTAKLTIRTRDPKGKPISADVSLGVVDESIYAIREDGFNILESFYPRRSNEVATTYSFAEVYLDGGDKGSPNVSIRRKFLDTAAWMPSVQTGLDGIANVTVTLPDNLTEWRATAVGVTDDTIVGKAIAKFNVRKDLMVRLEMPDYMVQGDRSQMNVIVTNDTGVDQSVHLNLVGTGIAIEGKSNQTVLVSKDKPTAVPFTLNTHDPGPAMLTAKAWIDGGANDGVEQGFQVFAHGIPEWQSQSDVMTQSKSFEVRLAPNTDRTTGRLKIDLSSTMTGALMNSLDGLVGFPYGCVEQTMSRFMPSVLVEKTVRELGIPKPALHSQIVKIAEDSMVRLGVMQHSDGGWGWWQNDKSDPFMTALVLDGLDRSRQAGYPTHKADTGKAIDWCIKRMKSKDWKNDSLRNRSYVVYALSRYGKSKEAVQAMEGLILRKADASVLATVALAANGLGPKYEAKRDAYLDRLVRTAHQSPKGAYWSDGDEEWGAEGTAICLTAFMAGRPSDPIVPRIVRYLMARRRFDMWDSTRDTSYVLVGLTAYMSRTKELAGGFDARVTVNGRLAGNVHLIPTSIDGAAKSFTIPVSEMQPGSNVVRIEMKGKGTCYSSLDLKATQIETPILPSNPVPGFHISRKYFVMETRKLEDGTLRLLPSRRPVTSATSGDTIRVELTIESTKPREFLLIEDPTPSNCRVTEREELDEGEEWTYWWDKIVVRDEKVCFFVRRLPEGKQTITYNMKAEGIGVSNALPTALSSMYDISLSAAGPETPMEVK